MDIIYYHSHLKGDYCCFSELYKCYFEESNVCYNSTEQYLYAMKAILFEDIDTYNEIMNCDTPLKIKFIGKKIKNIDNEIWDQYKFDYLSNGNYLKFSQNDEFKKLLIDTKKAILIETSVDKEWGIGLNLKDILNGKCGEGSNLHGQSLMKIRKNIQNNKKIEKIL